MDRDRYVLILTVVAFLACTMLYACKEKFTPVIKDNNVNYLVVEGLINTGADSTIFSLTRTFKLDGKAIVAPEKSAVVQVESETGATYVLPELVKAGYYGRPSLNLDQNQKYRLRIRTKDNRQYLSDFVESKISPPIDDITLDFRNNIMGINANTHDPSGKSGYYQYSYVETWQQDAQLYSILKLVNHQILPRQMPEDNIFNCWHIVPSSTILLGSTVNLTEDRLEDKSLILIPAQSPKLSIQYSMLVKQRVLTKQAFDFWETMRKNTEAVGSIFDAQPSQLFGNIRSTTDPSEIVIGFISAGTVAEKRITITPDMLPAGYWRGKDISSDCIQDTILFRDPLYGDHVKLVLTGPDRPVYIPINEYWPVGSPVLAGYFATSVTQCVDCRALGGINRRPSYWK